MDKLECKILNYVLWGWLSWLMSCLCTHRTGSLTQMDVAWQSFVLPDLNTNKQWFLSWLFDHWEIEKHAQSRVQQLIQGHIFLPHLDISFWSHTHISVFTLVYSSIVPCTRISMPNTNNTNADSSVPHVVTWKVSMWRSERWIGLSNSYAAARHTHTVNVGVAMCRFVRRQEFEKHYQ